MNRFRGPLLAAALPTGLVLLVLATVAGPADLFARPGRPPTFPSGSPRPTQSGATANPLQRAYDAPKSHTFAWVGTLLAWIVIALIVLAAALVLRWLWLHRPRRDAARTTPRFEPVPVASLEEALAADRAGQGARLDEGDPRNGIVRCWLRLEEVIAEAGLPRHPAETSTEFTVRVLKSLDIDPVAIGRLAALFREARFSDHRLPETMRDQARDALDAIHRELGAVRGGVGP